ncbi:MAG: hypothetical protein HC915_18510 [Anaerolineae bacterium]|nr:hypothetical protein [Anaerolineae bacterium]
MAAKEDLAPLIDDVAAGMNSNEFTTYAFMRAFARHHEKAFVKALHENLEHPAGPFGALREIFEQLLEASARAALLRDGARDMDLFDLPGTAKLWQKKAG